MRVRIRVRPKEMILGSAMTLASAAMPCFFAAQALSRSNQVQQHPLHYIPTATQLAAPAEPRLPVAAINRSRHPRKQGPPLPRHGPSAGSPPPALPEAPPLAVAVGQTAPHLAPPSDSALPPASITVKLRRRMRKDLTGTLTLFGGEIELRAAGSLERLVVARVERTSDGITVIGNATLPRLHLRLLTKRDAALLDAFSAGPDAPATVHSKSAVWKLSWN